METGMRRLSPDEREALLIDLLLSLQQGKLTEGGLLRRLRKDILGMNQDEYAALVKVSRRTLSDIERDSGSRSLQVLDRVFRPLGLKMGLMPRSVRVLEKMLESHARNEVLRQNG